MNLKEARRQRDFTQEDLAGILQISVTALSLIENGHVFPKEVTRERIEKVFNRPISWHKLDLRVMHEMICEFIGADLKRANMLKTFIDRVVDSQTLDILNYTKSKQS